VKTPEQIADEILRTEGGFVNDPDDLGGATNRGVTIGTLRRLGVDVDGDGDTDVDDLRQLTHAQAREIYLKEYYYRPKIDRLPEDLRGSVFDMSVNAGSRSVKLLQQLLDDMGYDCGVDGKIGPQTIKLAHAAAKAKGPMFVDGYGIARRNYYYRIADKRVKNRKYARRRDGSKGGWITRVEKFIRPEFRLSAAQHRERTAAWG
jgi:lysozyme family protein